MSKNSTTKGHLEVVCGSMFSGKSEELIRRIKRAKIAQKEVVTFKHALDDRSTIEYVVSHDGSKIEAHPIDNAYAMLSIVTPLTHTIGIDEAQFFSHELINVVLDLLDQGKHIIVAGLNVDFRGVPFGPMPTLLAMADTVTKLSAICVICGDDAYFSQRIVNGKPAQADEPLIKVGAQESYQARCRDCFSIDKRPQWQNSL